MPLTTKQRATAAFNCLSNIYIYCLCHHLLPSFANFHICSVFVFSPSFHSAFRFYCAALFLFSFKIAFHKTFFLIIIYPLLNSPISIRTFRLEQRSSKAHPTIQEVYASFSQSVHISVLGRLLCCASIPSPFFARRTPNDRI